MHVRKRMYKHLELYPHTSKFKRGVDKVAYLFGIVLPLFTIPQLYKIWVLKNAAGVSLTSWAVFSVGAIFWIFYGIVHKEMPIIISQILWFVLQLAIVIGILMYG